jgi:hypothetical protein
MALSTHDLPNGAKVMRQEYVADEDSLGNFEREFDVSAVRFVARMFKTEGIRAARSGPPTWRRSPRNSLRG